MILNLPPLFGPLVVSAKRYGELKQAFGIPEAQLSIQVRSCTPFK